MTKYYEVTWANIYMADNPLDALRQAMGDIETVANNPEEGPNLFLIRDWDARNAGEPNEPVIMWATAIHDMEDSES